MFEDDELEAMQADLNESLPDTCVIQAATSVSDGMGGYTETYAGTGTVSCRVSPRADVPGEQDIGGRLAGANLWTVTLPAGTSVANEQRITSDGRTFEVVAVTGPRSYEVSRRAICKEAT